MTVYSSLETHGTSSHPDLQAANLADLRNLMTFVIRTKGRTCLGTIREDWKPVVEKAVELGVRV